MFRQAKTGMGQAFTFGKANVKLFTQFKQQIAFKDVAGLKEAKEELMEIVDFLKNPKNIWKSGPLSREEYCFWGRRAAGKLMSPERLPEKAMCRFFTFPARNS